MRPAQADWNTEHTGERAPANRTRAPEYGPETPVETATEARQGLIEHKVSTVLVVSTGAVIVAFALVYALFFG